MPSSVSQSQHSLSPVAPSFHPRRSTASRGSAARAHPAPASSSALAGGVGRDSAAGPRSNQPPKFASKHLVAPPPRWYQCIRGSTTTRATTTTTSSSLTASVDRSGATDGRPYAFNHEGLSQEVMDFAEYLALTPQEHAARQELIAEVEAATNKIWGAENANVFVYGSYALSVSLPTSDVDMAVLLPPDATTATLSPTRGGAEPLTALHLLAKQLSESPRLRANVIDQCRVPVVHIQDTWTGVSGDVSMTVPCIAAVVEQQQTWLAAHPIAMPMILLTKAALKQWGMNSTFTGGISSTCVYLLVRRFLEECAPTHPRRCMLRADVGSGTPSPQPFAGMHGCLPSSSFECDSPTGLSTPGNTTSPVETPRSDARSGAASPLFPALMAAHAAGSTGKQTPPPPPHLASEGDGSVSSFCQPSVPDASAPQQILLSQLLLDFWRYCGHDSFSRGFKLANTFIPEALKTMDDASSAFNFDVSKGAFRIGEVQVLFRHSVAVLEQLAGSHPALVAPWSVQQPVSPLSAVLTDPRGSASSPGVHSNARRRRCDHY